MAKTVFIDLLKTLFKMEWQKLYSSASRRQSLRLKKTVFIDNFFRFSRKICFIVQLNLLFYFEEKQLYIVYITTSFSFKKSASIRASDAHLFINVCLTLTLFNLSHLRRKKVNDRSLFVVIFENT